MRNLTVHEYIVFSNLVRNELTKIAFDRVGE